MSTKRENFGWLPMSYRSHAEEFAINLQNKFKSLDSQDECVNDEPSWQNLEKETNKTGEFQNILNEEGNFFLELSNEFVDKICQDVNENVISEVKKAEKTEEFEEVDLIDNKKGFIEEITEEILSNTFKIVEDTNSKCINGVEEEEKDEDINIKFPNLVIEECFDENSCEIDVVDHCNAAMVSQSEDYLVNRVTCNQFREYSEDDMIFPKVRRCSSLKTGKSPPGSPGRKKIVRFADVLGLDLADVRTYLDEIPKIPNSAYNDLVDTNLNASLTFLENDKHQRTLLALFQKPGTKEDFLEKVKTNNVMLEDAFLEDEISFAIRGTIRVRNLDYNKTVHIRYTFDSWKTYSDLQGRYIENSSDGFSDKFSFLLYAHNLSIGQKIEFAVRFQCNGNQYWDSNGGSNYIFQCLPAAIPMTYSPITSGLNEQIATFYYSVKEETGEEAKTSELTSSAVQDYIMHSLQKNSSKCEMTQSGKPELLTIFFVLLFSIIFLYVKKSILY